MEKIKNDKDLYYKVDMIIDILNQQNNMHEKYISKYFVTSAEYLTYLKIYIPEFVNHDVIKDIRQYIYRKNRLSKKYGCFYKEEGYRNCIIYPMDFLFDIELGVCKRLVNNLTFENKKKNKKYKWTEVQKPEIDKLVKHCLDKITAITDNEFRHYYEFATDEDPRDYPEEATGED